MWIYSKFPHKHKNLKNIIVRVFQMEEKTEKLKAKRLKINWQIISCCDFHILNQNVWQSSGISTSWHIVSSC